MQNINHLLSLLNQDQTDLEELTIYFIGGFELNFNNLLPQLWRGEEYYGVHDHYWEELLEYDGLLIEGVVYEFTNFDYLGDS